jgi:hypothetical protein
MPYTVKHKYERFHFLTAEWDVAKAWGIVAAWSKHQRYRRRRICSIVNAPTALIAINQDIVAVADLSLPLLAVVEQGSLFVIDGWHRIAKAQKEGVTTLPAFVFLDHENKKIRVR